jgi:hypothetical protein
MAEHSLATYLNDHLAGSVAAVELLELIDQTHVGDDKGRARWSEAQGHAPTSSVPLPADGPLDRAAGAGLGRFTPWASPTEAMRRMVQ